MSDPARGVAAADRRRCQTAQVSSRRIALFLAASLVVAACSNDDDAEHNTTSPSTIDEIVDIRDLPGAEVAAGALDDVGELTCESGGGGWTASADVSNSTDGVVSY
ncbi:MAG: hypothetical protein ACERLM_06365, partial [Acidimicrobiales bacterium]